MGRGRERGVRGLGTYGRRRYVRGGMDHKGEVEGVIAYLGLDSTTNLVVHGAVTVAARGTWAADVDVPGLGAVQLDAAEG